MSKGICTCYLDGQLQVCVLKKDSSCLKLERESKVIENEYRKTTSRKPKGL